MSFRARKKREMLKERSEQSIVLNSQSNSFSSSRHFTKYVATPNRRERRLEFGIDMLDTVVFGHW